MSDLTACNEAIGTDEGGEPLSASRGPVLLGVLALVIGFLAAMAGAWLGAGEAGMAIALPAGLPALASDAAAPFMAMTGAVTMVLGGVSLYRSDES
jgi:hypothetical protein